MKDAQKLDLRPLCKSLDDMNENERLPTQDEEVRALLLRRVPRQRQQLRLGVGLREEVHCGGGRQGGEGGHG